MPVSRRRLEVAAVGAKALQAAIRGDRADGRKAAGEALQTAFGFGEAIRRHREAQLVVVPAAFVVAMLVCFAFAEPILFRRPNDSPA